MRLRAQLIVAFLLLAVVPLAGVTLYSYYSSLRALQRAAQAESDQLADEIERRMGTVTADLRRRIDRLTGLPRWAVDGPDVEQAVRDTDRLQRMVVAEMGDAAKYLEAIEFTPAPPAPEGLEAPPPGAPADPVQIQIAADLDAPAAGETATSFQFVLEEADDGSLLVRRRAEPSSPPPHENGEAGAGRAPGAGPAGAVAAAPDAGGAASEGDGGGVFLKGLESLAKELESRDRLRQAGVPVPPAQEEELRSQLLQDLGRQQAEVARIGAVRAQINSRVVLREVMSRARGERGEIPFALDREGNIYTPDPAYLSELEGLHLAESLRRGEDRLGGEIVNDWITVFREDPVTGLHFGIARPVGGSLDELRAAAVRNLGYGMGMVGLALLGILPLSGRMTRNLERLRRGADALAVGDLTARVTVRSRDEFGVLAGTFNRMAEQLGESQRRLVEQERLRREVEIGRQIQQELLPRDAFSSAAAEVKGLSISAREVGGDFFNYFALPDGGVALLVGDVSGKGVGAALLMANIQATLRATLPVSSSLADMVDRLDREIERNTPQGMYVTLFVAVLNPAARTLRWVNAGHPPPFAVATDGRVVRLDPSGRPPGLLAGGGYVERTVRLEEGGVLLLYTDGVVEMENEAGEEFGMERLEETLVRRRSSCIDDLLAGVEDAVRRHRGSREALDDATFLALRLPGPA